MKMTQEDAKKKFCPMARIVGGMNRWSNTGGMVGFTVCLGSQCMMWRWDPDNCSVGFCGLAEQVERSRKYGKL